ncbi:hypothetical protein D3C74_433540 [compost metagenome]
MVLAPHVSRVGARIGSSAPEVISIDVLQRHSDPQMPGVVQRLLIADVHPTHCLELIEEWPRRVGDGNVLAGAEPCNGLFLLGGWILQCEFSAGLRFGRPRGTE